MWEKKAKKQKVPEADLDAQYLDIWLPGDKDDFKEDPLPSGPSLLNTEHITRRVAAQRSRFMVFGADPAWLNNLAKQRDSRICRITIPVKFIPDIQQDLRDCGITESVIFPDLDGMGREVGQLWEQFKAL